MTGVVDASSSNGVVLTKTSTRAWWTAILYIATAAMLLRFYDLPLKPLHHDEGVNGFFLTNLVRPPQTYQYDPTNYHGPTLFYFGWLSVTVFGFSTVAIRLVTAFAGFLAVLLLAMLTRQLGTVGALGAAILLALSPGAVYLSRYFIHEMIFVCATIGIVVATSRWLERRAQLYLYLASASAGLMFATKETAIISAAVLAGSVIGTSVWLHVRNPQHVEAKRPVMSRLKSVIDDGLSWIQAARPPRSLVRPAIALGVFLVINLMFYTSFATHWRGALDALSAFAFWAKTGTTDHTQPPWTYLEWLAADELPLLVLGGAGAILALWKSQNGFAVFAALWAIGTLTAYSIVPYKTPWLTLNIVAPLAVSGGYLLEWVWHRGASVRRAALVAITAVVAFGAYKAVVLSFVEYDDERHSYVYAHTSREILQLVRDVNRIEALNPAATIAVMSKDQFPLSWYLLRYPAGYYGRVVATDAGIVIASDDQSIRANPQEQDRYVRTGTYRLRPGVDLVLYVRHDLKRPSSVTRGG